MLSFKQLSYWSFPKIEYFSKVMWRGEKHLPRSKSDPIWKQQIRLCIRHPLYCSSWNWIFVFLLISTTHLRISCGKQSPFGYKYWSPIKVVTSGFPSDLGTSKGPYTRLRTRAAINKAGRLFPRSISNKGRT